VGFPAGLGPAPLQVLTGPPLRSARCREHHKRVDQKQAPTSRFVGAVEWCMGLRCSRCLC
jgi:hypothetical protein